MIPAGFDREILPVLAPAVAGAMARAAPRLKAPLEEIRLRAGRPVQLVCSGAEFWLGEGGEPAREPAGALGLGPEELQRSFQLMARGSVYAWEDEMRSGFLTLPGGHRVGLAGRCVLTDGKVSTLSHVASLNLRIAREVHGAATPVLARLARHGRVPSTLLLSPPQAGKTTILRDLVRQISEGVPVLGMPGRKVAVVDERSELAGCAHGVPQRDLGPRTDVLDGCPKAEGLMMMIRSLSPEVAAVDEIGRAADADAVLEALHAGVTVLATAHGQSLSDLARRPALERLLSAGAFERVVILGRSRGPGTVERVIEIPESGGERHVG